MTAKHAVKSLGLLYIGENALCAYAQFGRVPYNRCGQHAGNTTMAAIGGAGAKRRVREQLRLDEREVRLIKALLQQDDMNDQRVQAIFSHLGRTINHREIGYVRTGHIKYSHIDAATELETKEFLTQYRRTQILMMKNKLLPAGAHFELLVKAREAMLAAIATYNNPTIEFKSEMFITNAMIAWTYLMHAFYQTKGVGYAYDGQITKHGQPKLYELGKCIRLQACPVDRHTVNNLEYLLEIRHEIEHRMTENIDASISAKLQSCVLNFNDYAGEWFGDEYRIDHMLPFSIQLSQISLSQHAQLKGAKGLPQIVETVNVAYEGQLTDEEVSHPRYAYKVYLVPRVSNRANSADEAVEYLHPESEKGRELQYAIKEVEKTKHLPGAIVKLMQREGHRWFRMHELTTFWKDIDGKNAAKGFGVDVGGRWLWYDHFLPLVRDYCRKKGAA